MLHLTLQATTAARPAGTSMMHAAADVQSHEAHESNTPYLPGQSCEPHISPPQSTILLKAAMHAIGRACCQHTLPNAAHSEAANTQKLLLVCCQHKRKVDPSTQTPFSSPEQAPIAGVPRNLSR